MPCRDLRCNQSRIHRSSGSTKLVFTDELGDEARKHISVLSLIRRKQLIEVNDDGPEEESLYRRINDQLKEVTVELLKVEVPSE